MFHVKHFTIYNRKSEFAVFRSIKDYLTPQNTTNPA